MQVVELAAQRRFSPAKFQKVNLFDSPRMFCDLYCFEPGQSQAPHAHEGADKIYCVLEGKGKFSVGSESQELGAGQAVLCPPGEEHGVVNTSDQRLVILVFMAPHP